jgi:uncharacterized membrane protein YjjP (DUF1212 family)
MRLPRATVESWPTRRRDWAIAIAIPFVALAVSLLTGDRNWLLVIGATYVAVILFYLLRYLRERPRR